MKRKVIVGDLRFISKTELANWRELLEAVRKMKPKKKGKKGRC